MSIFNVISMLGGLALFLYGMNVMGDGLTKASGGRLERILEKLTSSTMRGVLLGAAVTAVIQSSSATTVMVVGFVNSGIMTLQRALGIIMGANIGTTVTSWILSLSGIQGDSFFVKMLKPSSFAPILALIGIIFLMFSKKEKRKNVGTILVGFAVLMSGMEAMSGAVKPLANVPAFTNLLITFRNPILGMMAGALLTAIIQSSSASVGILQALCATGSVSFGAAIPIIMGQNIGTCVTALISSIGARKNAKRAAFVHFYFNLIGTLVFMALFFGVNRLIHFSFLNDAAGAAGIAVVHTAFNVAATVMWLPFGKVLVWLAEKTIRDSAEEKEDEDRRVGTLSVLDPRFLDTPALALSQCERICQQMAEMTMDALAMAGGLIEHYDAGKRERIDDIEKITDRYEDKLGAYLVQIAPGDLQEADRHALTVIMRSIGDIEQIADHAALIAKAAGEIHDKGLAFSDAAMTDLKRFVKEIDEMADHTMNALRDKNDREGLTVIGMEEKVNDMGRDMKRRHIERLQEGRCTIELGFILSDLVICYRRVANHCSDIAQYLL